MEETDSEIGRPVRKKRLKRVMKAKKRVTSHRLNSSRIHGLCINSSLNSTLLKQTLRTNNRALAKALEMKRQDLNVAQQIIIQLQEEQQHTQQQLSNLQHVAGLKENAIEAEVQLRIQSRMDDTKQVLSKVCMQLLSTVELIHGALDISTSRTSSVCRPATPAGDDMPSACKNVYYHGPPTTNEPKSPQCCTQAAPDIDIVAASAALDRSLGDVELATNAMTGHPDLSVILEQSQFMDAMPIPFTEDEPSEGRRFPSCVPVSQSSAKRQ
ncbi:hypothetical protein LSAT2_003457 [Lamellibrachia satsuma]|nr:hypothetical protein LSAT2_003457 [Lamellibrachia satsuma]